MIGTSQCMFMILCLMAALTGCTTTEQKVTLETLIDTRDSTRTLKLESEPSLKLALFGGLSNVEVIGKYTLTTTRGTALGTYSFSLNNKGERDYRFLGDDGLRWSGTRPSQGTLTAQPDGTHWELQKVVKETVAQANKVGPNWMLPW